MNIGAIKNKLLAETEKWLPFLFTPRGIIRVEIVMYIFKVLTKIGVGGMLAGSVIAAADGSHNISDIGEAFLVILAISFAAKTGNGKYPFGRRNIESLALLIIGCALLYLSLNVILVSGVGLSAALDIFPELQKLSSRDSIFFLAQSPEVKEWYWPLAGIYAVSVLLSFVVGTVQIHVGQTHAKPIIVGDGHETRSDGVIEGVVLVGLTGEYFFAAPWIEYLLGPVAGFYLGKTGFELLKNGWRTLLQRSVGEERESAIKVLAEQMRGVVSVAELKTCMIGGMALIIMKVFTLESVKTNRLIKKVLAEKIGDYLKASELADFDWYIRFDPPPPDYHRIAYAIVKKNGEEGFLAQNIMAATHFRIVDMCWNVPVRYSDSYMRGPANDRVSLLTKKKVRTIVSYEEGIPFEMNCLAKAGIGHQKAHTPDLAELGVP